MRKIITTLLITIIAGILFMGFVFAETGTVNVPELNFRENPSTNSDTLGVLNNGTKVNIISEQGDWYKIKYNNQEGYVSKQYVKKDASNNNTTTETTPNQTPNEEPTSTPPQASNAPDDTTPIDINELNKTNIKEEATMYVLPLLNSTKLGTLTAGTKVLLISVNGDFAYIQTERENAWILSKKLESTKITLASNAGNNAPSETQAPESSKEPSVTPTPEPTTQTSITPTPTPTTTTTPTQATPTPTNNNTQTYPTTMYVNVDAVNIRKESNTNSSIVTSAGKNVPVRVTAKEGDWYKVETSDGNGYIKGEFLSKTK